MKMFKHNIYLYVLLLISQNGYAQIEYFNRVYNYNVSNVIKGVVVKDTYYYTAGTIRDSVNVNNVQVYLNKHSQNGDIIWNKSWCETNTGYALAWTSPLITTHDNGFVIIGAMKDSTVYWYSFLMKLNSYGDTVWKNEYYDTISSVNYDYLGFNNVKETYDKGFVIVGEVMGSHQYDSEFYILKTDSVGDTEWFNTFGHPATIEGGCSVIQTPDTGYLIGGFRYVAGVDYSGDGLLVKTDKYGNKEWEKTIGGPYSDNIAYVTMSYDSNYLVGFSYAYQETIIGVPDREINVLKINPLKQVLWSKYYRIQSHHNVENIYELHDYSIVVVGTSFISDTINGASGFEGFIMKLNENGDSLWYRDYSYQSYLVQGARNYFDDIKPTADGGFIACGYFINNYQQFLQSGWLVKVDSMGCDTPGCVIIGIKEPQIDWDIGEVSVYPNPALDYINIEINIPVEGTLDFEMFDSYGRKVKEVKLKRPAQSVSVFEIDDGMYFYRVRNKNLVVGKGKVLVVR